MFKDAADFVAQVLIFLEDINTEQNTPAKFFELFKQQTMSC